MYMLLYLDHVRNITGLTNKDTPETPQCVIVLVHLGT